jgi:SOS-response transcriptional repressor LexA
MTTEPTTEMAPEISFRNQEVLKVLTELCNEHGMPPTLRQIGERMGFKSANSTLVHLRRLVAAGLVVQRGAGQSRGYMPVAWQEQLKAVMAACEKACSPIVTEL